MSLLVDTATDGRVRTSVCICISLVAHAALFVGLSRLHPGHPFPEVHEPISVVLLREPTAPAAPAQETDEPLPPAPQPPPRVERRPPPPAQIPPLVQTPPPAQPPAKPLLAEAETPAPPEPEVLRDVASDPPPAKAHSAPAPVTAVALRGDPAPEPSAPLDPNRVFSEGQVDRRAAPLDPVTPRYPERARQRGRESSVLLELTIDASGTLQSLEIVESGGRAFDRAAERAVRRARFAPAFFENRPVSSTLRYRLRFALR